MRYFFILLAALLTDAFPVGDSFGTSQIKSSNRCASQHVVLNKCIRSSRASFISFVKSSHSNSDIFEEKESFLETGDWLSGPFSGTEDSLNSELGQSNLTTQDNSVWEARATWLQERLSLKDKEIDKLVQRFPSILTLTPDTNLEPKLTYLQNRLELNDSKLRYTIQKYPQLLGFSISDNLEPTLLYLQERLQFNATKIGKIISKQPSVLGQAVNGKLELNVAWLQNRLDLTDAEVSKIIWHLPSLLSYSVCDKMETNLNWIQRRLKLSNSQLSKMIKRHPHILAYSIDDKMEPTLQWLQDHLRLENNAELAIIIGKMPTLFGCSIEMNLQPTLNFCIKAVGNAEVAISVLRNNPRIFSASLKNRLKPRLREAKKAGFSIDGACLMRMAKYTKGKWAANLSLKKRKTESRSQR